MVRSGDHFSPLSIRPKALALLAYLALAGREVARRDVARILFPESEAPLAVLRWHLAHVRSTAPEFIARRLRATRDRLVLRVPTDVTLFRKGADAICRRRRMVGAARVLALYRDDLVAGLAVSATAEFDTWLYIEQEKLRRVFRQAALAFARWAVATGKARDTLAPLARLVTVDPYCEDGHVELIHAYEALGQADRAAAAYERYQTVVRAELAAEPRSSLALRYEGRVCERRTLPAEHLVPLKEVTLHAVEWSGGEPAILAIHGSAGMAHNFGALADQLVPTHRFVAVDLRGHGFSDKPPAGYDLERHVADLSQLLRAIQLRRPILLGHSAGGTIATFLATRGEASGLVLLEAMIGDRAFAENAAAQAAPLATRIGSRFAGFDEYLAEWRARRERFSDDAERLVDRWARFALAPMPDGTYRERALRDAVEAEWASIVKADSLGALTRVACPVMIVQAVKPWIGGYPYFTRRIVDAQLRAAPTATLFVAHDSDHARILRDPEPAMTKALRTFIRDKCSPTGG